MKFDIHNHNRRVFILHTLAGACVAATVPQAHAATDTDAVKETDAYPNSMGFRLNTANVDQTKYPRHTLAQRCGECQLYSSKAGDPTGNCSFFKRVVPVDGWCRNFKQRKAAT